MNQVQDSVCSKQRIVAQGNTSDLGWVYFKGLPLSLKLHAKFRRIVIL